MVRKRQLCLINFEGRGSQLSKSSIKNTKYYSNNYFSFETGVKVSESYAFSMKTDANCGTVLIYKAFGCSFLSTFCIFALLNFFKPYSNCPSLPLK